jgi:hypothetical protein
MQSERVLFLSENIQKNSHAENLSIGMRSFCSIYIEIDYTKEYKSRGFFGLQEYIKRQASEAKITLIVILLGISKLVDPRFIYKLTQKEYKTILVLPDSEHCFEWHDRYYSQAVSLTWLFMPAMVGAFRLYNFPCTWGFGLSEKIYSQMPVDKNIDVSFVGGIYRSDRKEYLEYLKKNGINITIAGHGTELGSVGHEQMLDIIRRSKICINFTGAVSDKFLIHKKLSQCKGRIIEITFLGSFCLTEAAYGLEMLFTPGQEIDTFQSKEELLEKINYYLNNVENLNKIAAKGQMKAHCAHETTIVFEKVLKALSESNTYAPTSPILDYAFLREFNGTRMYWAGRNLSKLKVLNFVQELIAIESADIFLLRKGVIEFMRGFWHGIRANHG